MIDGNGEFGVSTTSKSRAGASIGVEEKNLVWRNLVGPIADLGGLS
jgi:hypothetical protein